MIFLYFIIDKWRSAGFPVLIYSVDECRRKILNPESCMCSYLRKIMPKWLRSLPGVEIETIGFDEDHLHMMMLIPPKYSISVVAPHAKNVQLAK